MSDNYGIVELIEQNAELKERWESLSESSRQTFIDVDNKVIVPNMLSDLMFKGIFDPRYNSEWISGFVSAILDRKIRIIRSLDKEGFRKSEKSKGVILDLLVEMEDKSLANVEVQRKGADMPPTRSVIYSAEMLLNQYAVIEGQKKKEVDYLSVNRVYSIIIMEDSPSGFHEFDSYIHHFSQKSDTGLDLELLQYYDYVCLDVFKESQSGGCQVQ